jgi:hypothetical protein
LKDALIKMISNDKQKQGLAAGRKQIGNHAEAGPFRLPIVARAKDQ